MDVGKAGSAHTIKGQALPIPELDDVRGRDILASHREEGT